jgi:DNA-binding transcriptional LysR family regulator
MNEDDISLRHLRVLTLLLEVGSLTRAAQILDTTQPTVSKILTKLRAHFGDPLFVRADFPSIRRRRRSNSPNL